MWTYLQASGEMRRPDGTRLTIGYSGHWDGTPPVGGPNDHRNRPDEQSVSNTGPIPMGRYTIGAAYDDVGGKGPVVMALAPDPSNQMFGRSAFLIHGDRAPPRSGTASNGCIVLDRASRNAMAASADRVLQVLGNPALGDAAGAARKAARKRAPAKTGDEPMKNDAATATLIRSPARYGWIPDLPDKRDQLFKAVRRIPAKLPAKVDLRRQCSAVEDQGNLGSCTANALVGLLEFLELKSSGKKKATELSRLFVYYNERVIEHTVARDAGAMLRDGIKSLAKLGVCPEPLWPYDIAMFDKRPASACFTAALRRTIGSYERLETISQMRACLADGFPFVFGFSVYESFESEAVANTGTVELPKKSERMLGGHAVCAVGYDDAKKRFFVRNSWGPDWGMKGYFTMPYDYLADRNLSDDFWTVRQVDYTKS